MSYLIFDNLLHTIVIIDNIKEQLIALKAKGHTYLDLQSFALKRGIYISLNRLKKCYKQWGVVNPSIPVIDNLVN